MGFLKRDVQKLGLDRVEGRRKNTTSTTCDAPCRRDKVALCHNEYKDCPVQGDPELLSGSLIKPSKCDESQVLPMASLH